MDTLIDSNVLIRLHDPTTEPYAKAAQRDLDELLYTGRGALSAQTLAEFAAFSSLHLGLGSQVILDQIERLRSLFTVLPITGDTVAKAVRLQVHRHIGLYEAQVRAVAMQNGLRYILSEDRQHRWHQDGIVYHNLLRHAPTGGWTVNQALPSSSL